MPVQIHLNGQRYFADDGTDPAELQQYAQMHQQEQAQLNPINQGMQNVFSGINRQIQNYNELPAPTAVPGNTYGMSSQAFNQTAGIIQQDNMNSATARMQQRVQMEQAMEQEKDRAQQIKVQDMQFKNQQKLEKMRQDQEEARLKREAEIGSVTNVSGVGPVHSGMKNGVPFASAVPIANAPAMQPEYVKSGTETVMENGVAVIKDIYVNKFDPKDTVAVNYGEAPPKSTAPRYGWVPQPDGTKIWGELKPGTVTPATPQKPLTPIQLMDVQKKAIELVRLRNGAWIDNDRMSENYGQVKPEFVNAFNAEVARELQAATGGGAPSVAPAPAQVGMPANPVVAEISQEDMQARDWALANPNDFRSTAILQHINAKYGITQAMTPMVPAVPTERATPASSTQVSEPISATAPSVDVAVPSTVPQQAPTTPPKQPLFDPFANPGILFRTPAIPAGSVTIPYQNQKSPFGTIFAPVYR